MLTSGILLAQKPKTRNIDSLMMMANNPKDDTFKISACGNLCKELKNAGRYDESVSYGIKGLQLSDKLNHERGRALCGNNLGLVYFRLGNYDSSIYYHSISLKARFAMKDTASTGMAYNNIGITYSAQGNFPLAINYFLLSMQIKEKIGDRKGLIAGYGNLGIIYDQMAQYDSALIKYQKAYELSQLVDDKPSIAQSLLNMGGIYQKQELYEQALSNYRRVLVMYPTSSKTKESATAHANIGQVYTNTRMYEYASLELDTAIALYRELGDNDGLPRALNINGSMLVEKGLSKEALPFFVEAYNLSVQSGNLIEKSRAAKGLADCYSMDGNFNLAYKYFVEYSQLEDSLYSDEVARATITAQLTYDYEKKEALAKAEEEARIEIDQKEIQKHKVFTWLVSGIAVMGLILAFFIFRGYRAKKIANEQLDLKNKEIEVKNREILDSINYAQRIQQSVLPEDETFQKLLPNAFVFYVPKDIVGGDFYYLEQGSEGTVFIAAADCTGHGVPGAFMSLICSKEMKIANSLTGSPGKILSIVNRGVKNTLRQNNMNANRDGMDVALLRIGKSEVHYSGANRPLWIIRKNSDQIEEFKATKFGIGGFTEDDQTYDTKIVEVKEGDQLFIFSDGYADQFGGDKMKKFTTKKLREFFISIRDLTPEEQKERMQTNIDSWRGSNEQIDDYLVIGIKF
jgi:serine phosphatase RsbU (regulator of sigma subunit)